MLRRVVRFGLGAIVVSVGMAFADEPKATPLTYQTTWTEPSGAKRSIRFEGAADRGDLKGTLHVDNLQVRVVGKIVGGRVTGTVQGPNGAEIAQFAGDRDAGGGARGTVNFGSFTQSWELPTSAVPAEVFGATN